MSAIQRKQCPRCGRFLPDSARVHWPCVLARLTQTWFVRLPAALLGTAAVLALLAALLINVPRLLLSSAPAAGDGAPPTAAQANLMTLMPRVGSASTAEVIVAEAVLYDAPRSNGRIVRTAARGERFAILAQAEAGGLWYQVETDTGPLWVAAFSVAVAQGDAPIPVMTVTAPTQTVVIAGVTPPPTLPLAPALTFPAPATAVPTVPVTLVQAACIASAQATAVLYSGPGTSFAALDTLTAGQSIVLDGQASDSGGSVWWRVQDSGLWVDSDLMRGDSACANLPFMAVASSLPPTPVDCPDGLPRRLRLGGEARALTDDLALARTAGGSEIVARLTARQTLTVIGGPVCAPLGLDSVTWWEMQAAPSVTGWAYEAAGGVYYLTPVE
jgi:hypothetical protein